MTEVQPARRSSALEGWLVSALAAASLAALLYYAGARLGALPRGHEVARFWWGAFAVVYLPLALLAWSVSAAVEKLSGHKLGGALQAPASALFFSYALYANRALVSGRFLQTEDLAARAALLLTLIAALLALTRASRWRWPRRAALVGAMVATLLAMVGSATPLPVPPPAVDLARPTGQRLLFIGVDGADPELVDKLLADGQLPNLAALRATGVSGNFATLKPTSSPLIWTTMITGRAPEDHGVLGHVFERPKWIFERVPERGETVAGLGVHSLRRQMLKAGLLVISPATSRERRVPALWNITTHFNQPLSVVSWWATWPAESILGRISSDRVNYFRWEARGATDMDRRRVTFPDSLFPILRRLIPDPSEISYEQAKRFLDVDPEQYERDRTRPYEHHEIRSEFRYYYSQFESDRAIARYFLHSDRAAKQTPMDLMVLFRLVDQTSHCCLAFSDLVRDPGKSESGDAGKYGRVVREAYRAVDEAIGELVEQFGPGNVIIVSDHGFERGKGKAQRGWGHSNAPPGIFIASGPAFRQGRAEHLGVSQLMSILLYLKGLPISDEIRAPLRQDLFTEAFAAATPVLRVPSFGTLAPASAMETESAADERLLDELKALGYIQ